MAADVDHQVQRLIAFLDRRGFDRDAINAFDAHIETMRTTIPAAERRTIANRLRREYRVHDTIRFNSVLFQLTGDLWYYERIIHFLLFTATEMDPAQLHYVYWCMQRQLFLGAAGSVKAASIFPCDVLRFYETLVWTVAERWSLAPPRRVPSADGIRRIAMVTNQFIGDRHQPSRDCFDFAVLLRESHGVEVVIINANLMPLQVENMFMPPTDAVMVEEYEGVHAIEMFGQRVKMASFTKRPFNRDKLSTIVESIVGYDPDLVLSFGGSNIVADLFALAGSRPVVCLPTTSGLTLSFADIVLGYDGSDPTAAIPELYRDPFASRFRPFSFGWTAPPLDPRVPPAELPEGAFVFAVVGTRLDHEVDGVFVALVEQVLERCPGSVAVFAGPVKTLPALLARSRMAGRMLTPGHLPDIRAFYRRCGAYLNPPRQGGGGSAAFALAEGLPVVTLPGGDVASVAGPSAQVPDPAAFVERAVRLHGDPEFRTDLGEQGRERFLTVHDRRRSVERLFEHCRDACVRFATRAGN